MIQTIIKTRLTELKNICSDLKIKKLYIFGSCVSNEFMKDSDIVTEQTLSNPCLIENIDQTKELIYEA